MDYESNRLKKTFGVWNEMLQNIESVLEGHVCWMKDER